MTAAMKEGEGYFFFSFIVVNETFDVRNITQMSYALRYTTGGAKKHVTISDDVSGRQACRSQSGSNVGSYVILKGLQVLNQFIVL